MVKLLVALAAILLLISSCRKTDDERINLLAGEWKLAAFCQNEVHYEYKWTFGEIKSFTVDIVTTDNTIHSVGTYQTYRDKIIIDCPYYGKDTVTVVGFENDVLAIQFLLGETYEFKRVK